MKVFAYNEAVARRGRPSLRFPLKRFTHKVDRGKDMAFLLSEKKRLYIVTGEGLKQYPERELEDAAFEKYAPLRDLKLQMLAHIYRIRFSRKTKEIEVECDLYDYHNHVLQQKQILCIPHAYKNIETLREFLVDFDNESVNIKKLQTNKENQRLWDDAQQDRLREGVSVSVLVAVCCLIAGLFIMRLFFVFGFIFSIRAFMKFYDLVESPYATNKKSAYLIVVNGVLAVFFATMIFEILSPLFAL